MNIVIVGGGVGGLAAAKELAGKSGIKVTLIDKTMRHDFAPSFLWLINGTREPQAISRSLKSLEREGVDVVEAEVKSVDTERQTLSTSAGELAYDRLILAPGAQLAPELVPGLEESADIFYTRDGAEKLHDALLNFTGGKVLITVASMPYKCPAAPYEAAFLVNDLLKKRGVGAEIKLVTAEPQPLPVAGPLIGKQVEAMLTANSIGFQANSALERVDGEAREAHFAGEYSESYDLLVAIPPHRPPAFIANSELAVKQGWIPVEPKTLKAQAAEDVYAIGDVTAIPLENGMMLPKAGVFAHKQAKIVAGNLLAKAPKKQFDGKGACFLEIGSGKAGFASGNFFASPIPEVKMKRPSRLWHLGKVLFEKSWLRKL